MRRPREGTGVDAGDEDEDDDADEDARLGFEARARRR